jgi:hypothetical protein
MNDGLKKFIRDSLIISIILLGFLTYIITR